MWGPNSYFYPPNYPQGNDVRFIPIPANQGDSKEAIKILKKELKELKKQINPSAGGKKEDDKKPRTYTFLETWALCLSFGVLVFMVSGIIWAIVLR